MSWGPSGTAMSAYTVAHLSYDRTTQHITQISNLQKSNTELKEQIEKLQTENTQLRETQKLMKEFLMPQIAKENERRKKVVKKYKRAFGKDAKVPKRMRLLQM